MISQSQTKPKELPQRQDISKVNLFDSLFSSDHLTDHYTNIQIKILQQIKTQNQQIWQFIPKICQTVNACVLQSGSLQKSNKQLNIQGQVFIKNKQTVFIGQNTLIQHGAFIQGPAYIGNNVILRKGAYIRGNVYIGDNTLIGNSVQIKNSIIFNSCQIAHFNYIGDSIIGCKAHFSAGAITSNLKLDSSFINIMIDNEKFMTKQTKIGAIIGEQVQIGCNAILNPGSIVCKKSVVYPLVNFRGFLRENKIIKLRQQTQIIEKKL